MHRIYFIHIIFKSKPKDIVTGTHICGKPESFVITEVGWSFLERAERRGV